MVSRKRQTSNVNRQTSNVKCECVCSLTTDNSYVKEYAASTFLFLNLLFLFLSCCYFIKQFFCYHRLVKLLLAVSVCRCNFLLVLKVKSIRLQTHEEQSVIAAVGSKQSLCLCFITCCDVNNNVCKELFTFMLSVSRGSRRCRRATCQQ